MTSSISSRITFLGCGSMNEAILGGLIAGGTAADHVVATVRRPERAAELRTRYGVTVLAGSETAGANVEAVRDAGVVIMGVKPAGTVALAREVAAALKPDAVVVSVAAAVSLELLEGALPEGQPVVRTMPNTPARVGRGVIAVSPGSHVTAGQLSIVKDLLGSAGTVVEVPESQLDAVSAVSGSGPAYAFYLTEAMAAAGVELGLDPDTSALLARETVSGAGVLLSEPGADATALRKAVSSPNGTTEAAIAAFDAQRLPGIIAAGARAAAARAADITAELKAADHG